MYLGEINIHNNLDLGALVSLNSAYRLLNPSAASTEATVDKPNSSSEVSSTDSSEQNLTTLDVYNGFYNGSYTVKDLAAAFSAELPVIPVCFGHGLVIYSEKLGKGISPTISDLFYNIENIK